MAPWEAQLSNRVGQQCPGDRGLCPLAQGPLCTNKLGNTGLTKLRCFYCRTSQSLYKAHNSSLLPSGTWLGPKRTRKWEQEEFKSSFHDRHTYHQHRCSQGHWGYIYQALPKYQASCYEPPTTYITESSQGHYKWCSEHLCDLPKDGKLVMPEAGLEPSPDYNQGNGCTALVPRPGSFPVPTPFPPNKIYLFVDFWSQREEVLPSQYSGGNESHFQKEKKVEFLRPEKFLPENNHHSIYWALTAARCRLRASCASSHENYR